MSLVAASEDNTSDQSGKPSAPPYLTSSTSTIIITRQNFYLAISTLDALPALQPTILSWFEKTLHFCQFIFCFSFLSLNMCEYVPFPCFIICHFYIPVCSQRLSRATHPPIFSCLAGAQFADCIICLATNHFVSV